MLKLKEKLTEIKRKKAKTLNIKEDLLGVSVSLHKDIWFVNIFLVLGEEDSFSEEVIESVSTSTLEECFKMLS